MHGHEHVVAARDDRTINRHSSGEELADQRKLRARKSKLPANSESQRAADEKKGQSGPEVLETDHFVIVGPEVFFDESDLVVVVVLMACVGGCFGGDGAHV